MSNEQALSNLDFLKTLAEAGQRQPLLGGPIGMMWSILLIPTLIFHGLTELGQTGLSEQYIGLVWFCFGVLGGLISIVMSRRIASKPGGKSVGNKIESVVWPVTGALIFTYAIALAISVVFMSTSNQFFDSIMPLAFALYALSNAVLAKLTAERYLTLAAIGSAVFMALCVVYISHPETYFIAAAGVFLTSLIPSYLEIRRESNHAG